MVFILLVRVSWQDFIEGLCEGIRIVCCLYVVWYYNIKFYLYKDIRYIEVEFFLIIVILLKIGCFCFVFVLCDFFVYNLFQVLFFYFCLVYRNFEEKYRFRVLFLIFFFSGIFAGVRVFREEIRNYCGFLVLDFVLRFFGSMSEEFGYFQGKGRQIRMQYDRLCEILFQNK